MAIDDSRIRKLAAREPVVYMAVQMAENGLCSWETACEEAMIALAQHKDALSKHLIEYVERRVTPIQIVMPDKAKENHV